MHLQASRNAREKLSSAKEGDRLTASDREDGFHFLAESKKSGVISEVMITPGFPVYISVVTPELMSDHSLEGVRLAVFTEDLRHLSLVTDPNRGKKIPVKDIAYYREIMTVASAKCLRRHLESI